jgi:PleD family two-component response regulator
MHAPYLVILPRFRVERARECATDYTNAYDVRRVSHESAVTERGRSRGVYVLVVHDEAADVSALSETLQNLFIVRETSNAFDTLERLSGSPLACVVCVIGGAIVAQDFFDLVKRAAPDQSQRIVFVASSDHDLAFLKSNGANVLPESSSPKEILAFVSAVSSKR